MTFACLKLLNVSYSLTIFTELCFCLATFLILLDICVGSTNFLTREQNHKRNLVPEEQFLNLMSVVLIPSDVYVARVVRLKYLFQYLFLGLVLGCKGVWLPK